MGYSAAGSGNVTFAGTREELVTALVAEFDIQPPTRRDDAAIVELLCTCAGVESCSITPDGFYLYYDRWDEDEVFAPLDRLASLGFTGELEFGGEDLAQWNVILAGGRAQEVSAAQYWPGHPDPTIDIVALNRNQVSALLAALTGDTTEHLPAAVAALTKALD